jgi:hypothetical protein
MSFIKILFSHKRKFILRRLLKPFLLAKNVSWAIASRIPRLMEPKKTSKVKLNFYA